MLTKASVIVNMKRLPNPKNVATDSAPEGQLIGYARVSTAEQSLDLQVDALRRAGVDDDHIFREKVSGVAVKRKMRDALLKEARRGDTIVVWKLDRLGRSMYELITLVRQMDERGIKFRSLTEGIDTTTSGGRLLMHILGALAQFERDQIAERTAAGIRARMRRGAKWGPERKLSDADIDRGRAFRAAGKTRREIAELLDVSEYTVHQYIIADVPHKHRLPKKPKKR